MENTVQSVQTGTHYHRFAFVFSKPHCHDEVKADFFLIYWHFYSSKECFLTCECEEFTYDGDAEHPPLEEEVC